MCRNQGEKESKTLYMDCAIIGGLEIQSKLSMYKLNFGGAGSASVKVGHINISKSSLNAYDIDIENDQIFVVLFRIEENETSTCIHSSYRNA